MNKSENSNDCCKREESNLEKLSRFIEDEDPDLFPAFIAVLEMCFHSEKHCLQKF